MPVAVMSTIILHGLSRHTHDDLSGDVGKLVEMRDRHNRGLGIQISNVCHKSNYRNIPQMVKLAEELRVDQVSFHNLIPPPTQECDQSQCLYESYPQVLDVIRGTTSPRANLEVVMPRPYTKSHEQRRCNVMFSSLYCNPRGDVSPRSQTIPQPCYRNILKDAKTWNVLNCRKCNRYS